MPRAVITGHSRGLGLEFYQHFVNKGWIVEGFNTITGLDGVIAAAEGCDLFINNAYANGIQIKFLNELYDKVGSMVVCGSVAAFYPDPNLPAYSLHKKDLLNRVKELNRSNVLLLNLSAKGYNDPQTVIKLVDFWLEHPSIIEITFDTTGEPNG